MKASDLRSKDFKELEQELIALLKERFNLLMLKRSGQPPKAQLFKKVKLGIARIKTILTEKGSKHDGSN